MLWRGDRRDLSGARICGGRDLTPPSAAAPLPELTDREREVLDLIAEGLDNSQIADLLYVSTKTVSNHISNIFAKLHLSDRAHAIVAAREAGLGKRGS